MGKRKTPARKEHDIHLKPLLPAFGERIAAIRRALGHSQTAAAAMIGISNKTLNNIERGENWPNLPVYLTLLKVYKQGKAALF